jgi:sugar/nucleoside kinase (ribokinase family)
VRFLAVGDLMVDVLVSGSGHDARMVLTPGGSAFNAACTAAALGADATVVGRVGDDAAGRLLLAEAAARGVNSEIAVDPEAATGTFLDVDGEIRADRGANARFRPEHLPAVAADAVLVSGYLPDETVTAALEEAEASWLALEVGRLRVLPPRANVVLANEDSARRLTGQDPDDAARELASGRRLACVTLGGRGAVAATDGHVRHVSAPDSGRAGADVAGAGDAFAAGLLVALAGGASIDDALAAACRAGAVRTGGTV